MHDVAPLAIRMGLRYAFRCEILSVRNYLGGEEQRRWVELLQSTLRWRLQLCFPLEKEDDPITRFEVDSIVECVQLVHLPNCKPSLCSFAALNPVGRLSMIVTH